MLQPKGAALLGASLALIAVGLVRIDGIMITLGGAALLLFVAAFLFGRRNLRRLAVVMRAPARLYADAPFDLRLTLYNHRRFLDAFHVDLTVHFPGGPSVHSHAPWTAARSSSTVHHRASLPQRGAFPTHHFTLSSTAPLGLFHFAASGKIVHEILVFPRPLTPRELFSQGGLHDASMLAGSTPGHAPGEPRGIRPWQAGDSAKYIHWPASARSLSRRRGLRIRENDPPGFHPKHAAVFFHSFGTSGELIREDRFDRGLSLVCGTLRHLLDHGIPTTFYADFLGWEPQPIMDRAQFANLLVALARAERANDTEAHDLLAVSRNVGDDHSLLILSDMPPDTWNHILPGRSAIVIDIRQHRYERRPLTTGAR